MALANVYSQFTNAVADRFCIAQTPGSNSSQTFDHSAQNFHVAQRVKPDIKWSRPAIIRSEDNGLYGLCLYRHG